jgi:hypothetical protein
MAGLIHGTSHIAVRILVDLSATALGLATGTLLGVSEWAGQRARRRRD